MKPVNSNNTVALTVARVVAPRSHRSAALMKSAAITPRQRPPENAQDATTVATHTIGRVAEPRRRLASVTTQWLAIRQAMVTTRSAMSSGQPRRSTRP